MRQKRATERPAKITQPRVVSAVPRRRLFAKLDRVRRGGGGAVWVCGPPGAGKTMLVSTWIEARGAPASWLKIDAGDADLATFFHYLRLATQTAGTVRPALPTPSLEHGDDLGTFARLFFRSMYAALPRDAVVALDDCHAASEDPAFRDALRAAIEELPASVTLVLASRADSPPALARLRAHDALEVISARELELTGPESWALARSRGFSGSRSRVEASRRTARGWAAGLVLLLERNCGSSSDAVSGSATFEYFVGEVFDKEDGATRRILLESALLESPGAEVVEKVTGDPNASRILSSLARRGLFVVRREATPAVFELHGLFREFLLARGREELPRGRAAQIRRNAAVLLAGEGGASAEAAIALLAEERAFEEMAALVVREAPGLMLAGRWQTVERWIELLPPRIRRSDGWVLHWSGAAHLLRDPAIARDRLHRALRKFEEAGNAAGAWLTWATLVDAVLFEWNDLTPLAGLLRRRARLAERFPFPSPEIAARVTLASFAAAIFHQPNHEALPGWAESVREMAASAPIPTVRIAAGAFLLLFEGWHRGDFTRNRELVAELGALARGPGVPPRLALHWLSCEATYAFFAGSFEACAAAAADAIAKAEKNGIHVRDYLARFQQFSVALARAPAETAACLGAMERALRGGSVADVATMHLAHAIEALARGDARVVVRRGEEGLARATESGYAFAQELARLILARARARAGDLENARRDLAHARAAGKKGSDWARFMAALVTVEHALDGARPDEAATPLSLAFGIARERGFHGFPVFSWKDMSRFCAEALARGIEPEFVKALVASERLAPPDELAKPDTWPWELRIRLLGGFEISRANGELPDPARHRKPFALLRAIAVFGGRGQVRQEVVEEALWPDAEGDAAHHALETTLYRLRLLVGQDAVVQRDRKLSLAPKLCWVDALDLEAHLRRELRRLEQPERVTRDAMLKSASRIIELYRGPLLPDEGDPWAASHRERLRRQLADWLHALRALPGDPADAASLRAAIVEADPAIGAGAMLRIA